MILLYDGSFENFLNLVYEVYYKKLQVSAIYKEAPQTLLLEELHICEYDEQSSLKVYDAIQKNFSQKNFERVLHIFMCDTLSFEMDLLHYIILGFRSQTLLEDINTSSVFKIMGYEKQLFSNVHKMTGFLRFEELEDGALYAKLESRFNLLYFLGKHFSKRFNNQIYYIHDIKRSLVFIHSQEFTGVRELDSFETPTLSPNEQKFQKLWQQFFESVTIESRKNQKLQKNVVPLLYRTYMNEFIN